MARDLAPGPGTDLRRFAEWPEGIGPLFRAMVAMLVTTGKEDI